MLGEIHAVLDVLKLRYTRQTIAETLRQAQRKKLSYTAFLLDILRREIEDKKNRSLVHRLAHCGLDEYWTLETFPWHIQTCLARHRKAIEELAELDFLDRGESIVFVGHAGAGKSGLASGILIKALFAGRSARAIKAQDLFEELGASLADRTTKTLLKGLSKLDLLLIDEFGYVNPPSQIQINNFFRLLDNRANRKSCLITASLGFDEWGKFLGNSSLTPALLSRLLQKCHVFSFPLSAFNLRDPKHKLAARAPLAQVLKAYSQNSADSDSKPAANPA